MNKKASLVVIVVLILILLYIPLSSGVCISANTPRIQSVNYFQINEDDLFVFDFNVTNMDEEDVSFTYALIDQELTGVSLTKRGVFTFTPSSDDVGISKIAILAVREECADTEVVILDIYQRPDIVFFEPRNTSLQINQTDTVVFRARADGGRGEAIKYEWFFETKLVEGATNKTSFTFRPGYGRAGVFNITVKATNQYNLSAYQTWFVQASRVNRPPALVYEIPGYLVFRNTETGAYNLNDYFSDPDGGVLRFEAKQVEPSFDISGVAYTNLSVLISDTGFVTYTPGLDAKGHIYFTFIAYDILGASTESNTIRVDIVGTNQFGNLTTEEPSDYCGNMVCSPGEDCNTCPFDCGRCKEDDVGCMPNWNCTEWSPCMPANLMTRNCTDLNLCDDNRSMPDEVRACRYTATCDDGLKNGIEEGVDCGGPCEACPTCNDTIQNQGESGIDCGGPCPEICPSCWDKIQNQNESDIDCGGPCEACGGNRSCLKNKDCKSLRCEYLVCTFATCNDTIKNQGEGGIDCGGPCPKFCGNCTDGLMNQNEGGVDCGGFCKPCPSCDDGMKNQNEWLVDCGGKCKGCTFNDFFRAYFIVIIILIIILGLLPLIFFGSFVYMLLNPEKARSVYESDAGFGFLIEMNRIFRKWRGFRKKKPVLTPDTVKGFIGELTELGNRRDLKDKALYEQISRVYTALLGLPEEFDDNIFNLKLRASDIPLFMKVLFCGFYKKSEILPLATFVAPEQKDDMIVELKFLLGELMKG